MDRILAVIPVHNRRETTLAILESLQSLRKSSFRLDAFVIDDGSTDRTAEAIGQRFPETIVERGDGNLWWGGAINVGFRYALRHGYDYVYTLNDDIVLRENTLDELHKAAASVSETVCASVILREDDRILTAGFEFSRFLRNKLRNPHQGEDYEALCQDLMPCATLSTQSTLIPQSVFRQGLLIDEQRFPHNFSDTDFFDRVRRSGFSLVVVRRSVIQAEASSSNFHTFILNRKMEGILRSFGNVKYIHTLLTQWNIMTKIVGSGRESVCALRFINALSVVWLALRNFLPRGILLTSHCTENDPKQKKAFLSRQPTTIMRQLA